MKISSKGRYAVRIMVDISVAGKEYVSSSEIADRQNISIKYLEQIIAKLVKAKLLYSSRGALGGYKLTKKPSDYKMSEILAVTNDLPEFTPCLSNHINCPRRDKCSTIGCWETLSNLIYEYLNKITLQDLIDKTY